MLGSRDCTDVKTNPEWTADNFTKAQFISGLSLV